MINSSFDFMSDNFSFFVIKQKSRQGWVCVCVCMRLTSTGIRKLIFSDGCIFIYKFNIDKCIEIELLYI